MHLAGYATLTTSRFFFLNMRINSTPPAYIYLVSVYSYYYKIWQDHISHLILGKILHIIGGLCINYEHRVPEKNQHHLLPPLGVVQWHHWPTS